MDVIDRIEDELARQGARLELIGDVLDALADNLDHLHTDLVGLREVALIPRPACYPDLDDATRAAIADARERRRTR